MVEVNIRIGGCAYLRAQVSSNIRRGQVFAPIHWNDQVASDARIGKVVNPVVDALSGEPEFKHTPVFVQPFYTQWQGVLYVRQGFEHIVQSTIQNTIWWTKVTTAKQLAMNLQTVKNLAPRLQQLEGTSCHLPMKVLSGLIYKIKQHT